MVHSVAHPKTRALHHAHRTRARRGLFLLGGLLAAALVFGALGSFGSVPWLALGSAVLHTTYRLALAYGIALVLAVVIGLLVGGSPLSDVLFPVFDVLQNIPSFALIPLFIYFLGFSDRMIILFAVSSIVWPILFAILTAIKTAHADLSDAATIFGARGFRRISGYFAPLAYPAILTGSVVGIAIGWEAVIGAEIIVNTSGFGAFIEASGASGISQAAVAGMLAILVIVFVVNRLVWAPLLSESSKRYAS